MGKPKRELRTGYTTGACAAAAAKAATLALASQRPVDVVEISLPIGSVARFDVEKCVVSCKQAICSVIKDAGDDPDVTHGAEICATVRWTRQPGLAIDGGEGVGRVTKPGLGLEVGTAAINPMPRKMISQSIEAALGRDVADEGVEVIVSVPRGRELAAKTLNARLGIIGGISILGTTGIVKPFSTSAYKSCIAQALDVAAANGCSRVVLTTGGRTEKFAQAILALPQESFVQMGDFIGFALRQCAARDIKGVIIVAMIGKLSKIAAGSFQTHVSRSRVDHDFLSNIAADCSVPVEVVDRIRSASTARHFAEIVLESGAARVFGRICDLASAQCTRRAGGSVGVECVLVGFDGLVLGRSGGNA
ncbi:MAG: cobalt-precorrin-5B (C(1))-methyltransferase [Chloroflexi bacterium]|nr:cobalt-precorrin-5B (C(1))-methyltransferase [Chloroflexota bacterium]